MARPRDRVVCDAGGGARRALRRDPSVVVAPGHGRRGGRGAGRRRASRSNILRGDYAGSDSCARCHADIYRGVARLADAPDDAAAGAAPGFTRRSRPTRGNGADVSLQGRHGAARRARRRALRRADVGAVRRSPLSGHARHRRALPRGLRGRRGRRRPDARELLLPVSYVFETRSFRLKGYSVLVGERPGLRAGGVWSETCVFCHNTVPVLRRAVGRAGGPGRARLPGRRSSIACCRASGAGASTSTRTARRRCCARRRRRGRGGRGHAAARRATIGAPRSAHGIRELRSRFGARNFVEIGIGCEACHGGSREHVADPRVHPDFAPRSAFLQARPEAGGDDHARRAGQPRLRALPPGAVLALSVHLGGGDAAGRQAGRQLDHLGRGARLPARRLRAPDVVRDLPRSARRGSPRRSRSAGDARRQRGLRPLPPAVRAGARRSRRTRTTIRPAPARAASPATCRRRTWASATR